VLLTGVQTDGETGRLAANSSSTTSANAELLNKCDVIVSYSAVTTSPTEETGNASLRMLDAISGVELDMQRACTSGFVVRGRQASIGYSIM